MLALTAAAVDAHVALGSYGGHPTWLDQDGAAGATQQQTNKHPEHVNNPKGEGASAHTEARAVQHETKVNLQPANTTRPTAAACPQPGHHTQPLAAVHTPDVVNQQRRPRQLLSPHQAVQHVHRGGHPAQAVKVGVRGGGGGWQRRRRAARQLLQQ